MKDIKNIIKKEYNHIIKTLCFIGFLYITCIYTYELLFMREYIIKIYNLKYMIYKGWLFLILVSKYEFKEMVELGFINCDDYAITMRKHSKSRRHKHYCREDKYNKYLKWKSKQTTNKSGD